MHLQNRKVSLGNTKALTCSYFALVCSSVSLCTDPSGKQCAAVRTQQGEMRLPPQVNALPRDLLLNTAAIQGWSSTALKAPPTTFMLRSSLWPHCQPGHMRDRAACQSNRYCTSTYSISGQLATDKMISFSPDCAPAGLSVVRSEPAEIRWTKPFNMSY